jgi:hypothetical protein
MFVCVFCTHVLYFYLCLGWSGHHHCCGWCAPSMCTALCNNCTALFLTCLTTVAWWEAFGRLQLLFRAWAEYLSTLFWQGVSSCDICCPRCVCTSHPFAPTCPSRHFQILDCEQSGTQTKACQVQDHSTPQHSTLRELSEPHTQLIQTNPHSVVLMTLVTACVYRPQPHPYKHTLTNIRT